MCPSAMGFPAETWAPRLGRGGRLLSVRVCAPSAAPSARAGPVPSSPGALAGALRGRAMPRLNGD